MALRASKKVGCNLKKKIAFVCIVKAIVFGELFGIAMSY